MWVTAGSARVIDGRGQTWPIRATTQLSWAQPFRGPFADEVAYAQPFSATSFTLCAVIRATNR